MLNANIVPRDLLCSYKYTESSEYDSSLHVVVGTEFDSVYTPVYVFSFIKCFEGVGWKMKPKIKLVLL